MQSAVAAGKNIHHKKHTTKEKISNMTDVKHQPADQVSTPTIITAAPTYVFDLDLPPEQRWLPTLHDYKDQLQQAKQHIDKLLTALVPYAGVRWLLRRLLPYAPMMYKSELQCISQAADMPLGDVMLMQLVYELCAGCTSIIWRDSQNQHSLSRNMDWDLPFLKQLTIQLKVVRGDRPICSVATWVGYVGFLTGVTSQYAVAVNFRSTGGNILYNILRTLAWRWPVGFLVRELLTDTPTYWLARLKLYHAPLIAPCYFILCSTQTGCVIVRDPSAADEIPLAANSGCMYQTNMDQEAYQQTLQKRCQACDVDFLYSRRRYQILSTSLTNKLHHTAADIWDVLNLPVINNEETIYQSHLKPGVPFEIETRIVAVKDTDVQNL
jgi:hypothetical protein